MLVRATTSMATYLKTQAPPRSFPYFALLDGGTGRPVCHALSDGRASLVLCSDEKTLQEYQFRHERQDCPVIVIRRLQQLVSLLDCTRVGISHVTHYANRFSTGQTKPVAEFLAIVCSQLGC